VAGTAELGGRGDGRPARIAPQDGYFGTYFAASALIAAMAITVAPLSAQDAPGTPTMGQMTARAASASITTTGTIIGTIVDKDGAVIANARVKLTAGSFTSQIQSGGNGAFTFKDVPSGPFQVAISAPGFADQTQTGVLAAAQEFIVPEVQLVVATTVEIQVTQTQEEIAESRFT